MKSIRALPLFFAALSASCSSDTKPPLGRTDAGVALQSIAVSPATASIAKDETTTFTAMGTFTDGRTEALTNVTWISQNQGVATISGAGVATGVAVGSTEISAKIDEIIGRATLTVTQPPPAIESIALEPGRVTLAPGATDQLTATATFDDASTLDVTNTVEWSSSDESVATVAGGLITAIAPGSAIISARDAASGVESGDTSTDVTVRIEPPAELLVTPDSTTLAQGRTVQLTATAIFADGDRVDVTNEVIWVSSAVATATVSPAGLVFTLSEGFASITATHDSGVSDSATVRVGPPEIAAITVTPREPSVTVSSTQRFEATAMYTDGAQRALGGSVTWSSSDPTIATISNMSGQQGVATAVGVGRTTIAATHMMSGVSSDASGGSATLEVRPPELVSLLILPAAPSVPAGLTSQLEAFGVYSDNSGRNLSSVVNWSSTNPTIASVDATGLVTAHAVGTVTISAIEPVSGIGSDQSMSSSTFTVTPAILLSIAVTPPTVAMVVGTTRQFTATGLYSNAAQVNISGSVSWSSSSAAITISSTGLATAVANGMATIAARDPTTSVSSNDSNQSANALITDAQLVSIEVTPGTSTVPPGAELAFAAIGTYNNSATVDLTNLVTWSSNNTMLATISNDAATRGLATPLAPGRVTISALEQFTGISSDTTGQSATLTVPAGVSLQSLEITGADTTVGVNQSTTFTAEGTFTDTSVHAMTNSVTWSSSNQSVATISNTAGTRGRATGAGVGTSNISALHTGSGIMSNSVLLTIEQAILIADIVHYELEEGSGTVATNLAPGRPNGTINGVTSWISPGVTQGASNFRLNLANGGINNVNSNLPLTTYTNMTIEFWWRFGGGANLAYMWNSNSTFRAFTNGVAGIGFFVRETPGGTDVIYSGNVQDGQWKHVAYVLDATAGQGRLYVGGVQVGTTSYSGSISLSNWFLLGQNGTNGASIDYDRYRIWSQALTAAQIGEIIAGIR